MYVLYIHMYVCIFVCMYIYIERESDLYTFYASLFFLRSIASRAAQDCISKDVTKDVT